MSGTCSEANCTVSATGVCLLGLDPPAKCLNYDSTANAPASSASPPALGDQEPSLFFSGRAQGLRDTIAATNSGYAYLISILGEHDAGKTCLMTAVYLMCIKGILPHFAFCGSWTLPAWEDRARHARDWDGCPKTLPEHTTLSDKRDPSLLHIESLTKYGRMNLYFTDLPGEWTTDLITKGGLPNQFDFLPRSDALLIAFDSGKLTGSSAQLEVRNGKVIFERLAQNINLDRTLPITIVLTKADEVKLKVPPAVQEICEAAEQLGFAPTVVSTAAWSENRQIAKPGFGIEQLMDSVYSRSFIDASKISMTISSTYRNFLQTRD